MISWIIFFLDARSLELSVRLQNTFTTVHLQWLEDAGKPVGKFIQANSYKKITRNSLKVFFCAEEGFKVWTALLLFAVNCKRSLPTPFCEFWHVTVPFNIGMRTRRIRPIMRRITLTLTRKKPTYHKHSHMSLRLCRMLEWTFMHLFANGLYKWFRRVCGLAAT